MEFLRLGSSIPGSYWGCCAIDVIQDFKQDPDDKASIQVVSGDGGGALTKRGKHIYLGPTYKDIFLQRLRIGTFSSTDLPNHSFIAVLTDQQIRYGPGKKWLAILKETGFEFIRAVDNSVYSGSSLHYEKKPFPSHVNYVFALFRNIGKGKVQDPLQPPAAWTDLPSPKSDLEIWKEIGPVHFLTREELLEKGVPITLAGKRSVFPQQTEEARKVIEDGMKATTSAKPSAFPIISASPAVFVLDEEVCEDEDGDEGDSEDFWDEDEDETSEAA